MVSFSTPRWMPPNWLVRVPFHVSPFEPVTHPPSRESVMPLLTICENPVLTWMRTRDESGKAVHPDVDIDHGAVPTVPELVSHALGLLESNRMVHPPPWVAMSQ